MKTDEGRRKLIDEIEGYKIPLCSDPSVDGLKSLYETQARLDSYRDRVDSIHCEALDDLAEIEIILRDLNFDFKQKYLVESSKDIVKILKSADLRTTAVETLLTRELKNIKDAENDQTRCKLFFDKVSSVYSDIRNKMKTIETQLTIIGHMRTNGEFFNARPKSAGPGDVRIG